MAPRAAMHFNGGGVMSFGKTVTGPTAPRRRRHLSILNSLATAALVGVQQAAFAQVAASWVQPASGVWHGPANWSTNPLYPNNNNPGGERYDVTIATVGSPYTVTLSDP